MPSSGDRMGRVSNPLKGLLQRRHIHAYSAFVAEYERHARTLDLPTSPPSPPTKAQYYRWVADHIKTLPRAYHCAVLESMFPEWTARELFGFDEHADRRTESSEDSDVLSAIAPSLDHTLLAGLWCSGYILNGDQHHVDLSTITATTYGLTAKNYPPLPRFEGHPTGHKTDLSARLFNRHLLGHWRNVNDAYYFGSMHLIVLPGETVLEGYYTGFLDDRQIVAQPWRWIRIEPSSHAGVDLNEVTLQEPRELYSTLASQTRFGGPLSLSSVTES
jgi:hypothetical protein